MEISHLFGLRAMTRTPSEKSDLSLVTAMLRGHDLQALPFSKEEAHAGKTPDFRVMDGAGLFAYCEVKSPRDEWLDSQIDQAEPGVIVGGLRSDPVFNRLSKMIEKAGEQFDAVNPDRSVPNILAIVNHDEASHPGDLIETLTGMFNADNCTRHPTMPHISEGRIREAKYRIDLYVWIDGRTGRVHGYLFSESVPAHVDALCAKLGLEKAGIRRV
jgi:hypothetical protein